MPRKQMRSQDTSKRSGWFNPTLSFDGFAAIVAVIFVIRWMSQLDFKTDINTNSIARQDSQITKLSEAVTKLTIIAEINEKREQEKISKK